MSFAQGMARVTAEEIRRSNPRLVEELAGSGEDRHNQHRASQVW